MIERHRFDSGRGTKQVTKQNKIMPELATQIINGRVGISAQWMEACGIATLPSLRQKEHRMKLVPLTRGGRGVLKIYEYRSMPEELKR